MEETNSEINLRTCTKHENIGSIQSPRSNKDSCKAQKRSEEQVMQEARKMHFVFVLYMSLYYPVETVCSRYPHVKFISLLVSSMVIRVIY